MGYIRPLTLTLTLVHYSLKSLDMRNIARTLLTIKNIPSSHIPNPNPKTNNPILQGNHREENSVVSNINSVVCAQNTFCVLSLFPLTQVHESISSTAR